MNNVENLKLGDLVIFTYSGGYNYPVMFHSISKDKKGNDVACRSIGLSSDYQIEKIKSGEQTIKDVYKTRIQGYFYRRVWKITEDCLTEKELKNYYEWKKLFGIY